MLKERFGFINATEGGDGEEGLEAAAAATDDNIIRVVRREETLEIISQVAKGGDDFGFPLEEKE